MHLFFGSHVEVIMKRSRQQKRDLYLEQFIYCKRQASPFNL